GNAQFHGNRITRLSPINAWNHEMSTELQGDRTVTWDTLTTGNFGGFDAWLDDGAAGTLEIDTNHVSGRFDLTDIGMGDTVLDAGGLERRLRVFRLPTDKPCRDLKTTVPISLKPDGDNQIWLRVTTEDGFNAWSSPIFLYR
ncbi:MAG: DUF3604 domain-containing protein, partial [Alphaproteobacteria bacterium]